MAKVDVMMASYNSGRFIERAIASVLNQVTSHTVRLVIFDDASTDNTSHVLEKYKAHGRVVVAGSDINRGGTSTFVSCLGLVRSDYIMFLDADDYWIGNRVVEHLISYLEESNDHAVTSYQVIETESAFAQFDEKSISFLRFCLGYRFPMCATAVRVKSSLTDHWNVAVPFVTRNQSDLTVCLSLLAEGEVRQLPFASLFYNHRVGPDEANYNSIHTHWEKLGDKIKLISHNWRYYWFRPAFYLMFLGLLPRLLFLSIRETKLGKKFRELVRKTLEI